MNFLSTILLHKSYNINNVTLKLWKTLMGSYIFESQCPHSLKYLILEIYTGTINFSFNLPTRGKKPKNWALNT